LHPLFEGHRISSIELSRKSAVRVDDEDVDGSAKLVTRGWVDMLIGMTLLAGALVALWFPVYLGTYDKWGVQIKCGNGYFSQFADQFQSQFESQCNSALAHRRAMAIPVAAVGALIVVPELVAWARGGARSQAATANESWAEPTDTALHDAALLDRRYRSHRTRPSDTTL
jgi:hypothetical protein